MNARHVNREHVNRQQKNTERIHRQHIDRQQNSRQPTTESAHTLTSLSWMQEFEEVSSKDAATDAQRDAQANAPQHGHEAISWCSKATNINHTLLLLQHNARRHSADHAPWLGCVHQPHTFSSVLDNEVFAKVDAAAAHASSACHS